MGGNGLFAESIRSSKTKETVEDEILKFLEEYFVPKKCTLGGSSVHIDKEVLRREMPKVHDFLNHRIIDASSFEEIIRRWARPLEFQIKKKLEKDGDEIVHHRAMDDIMYSISFMKQVQEILFARR